MELTIREVAFPGQGVGRSEDGRVVFVEGVLPGERVRVAETRRHARYSMARLCEVLIPSPQRVAPVCPLARKPNGCPSDASPRVCPGCQYQHAAYEEELRIKDSQFRSLLGRMARVVPERIAAPIQAPASLDYRNKLVLRIFSANGRAAIGFVGEDNRTLVDVPRCRLALQPLGDLMESLRTDGHHPLHRSTASTLTLRYTVHDGAQWWTDKTRRMPDTSLTEIAPFGQVVVPRHGFWQVNPGILDNLVERVMACVAESECEALFDLYCGSGLFSLAAASHGTPSVFGIDWDRAAIAAARRNAAELGFGDIRFHAGPAHHALHELNRHAPNGRRNAVIVDPPRTGLDTGVLDVIRRAQPRSVIYVSCAPDTLGRDLARLQGGGYEVIRSGILDQFPRTAHFESVTLLIRSEPSPSSQSAKTDSHPR